MKLNIRHQTFYAFSSEVFLEPHYLRLYPRATPYTDVLEYTIKISPEPTGLSLQEDEEGNFVHFCWFENMTRALTVETEAVIDSKSFNPFNFLVYPGELNKFPFSYTETQKILLHTFLQPVAVSADLLDYGKHVDTGPNFDVIHFLANLTRKIHSDFVLVYREEGAPLHPDTTFMHKTGSCRDLTWMQMNMLRTWGFASRFVSGYFYFEMDTPSFELHGWLEVFVPGVGWIGLDPSHGIITGNSHIPLVACATVELSLPLSGTYRGSASAELSTKVSISEIKE
jgi:transglutaminase-like putative cysteine protease